MSNERIARFSLTERIAHWLHTISFFVLVLTGLIVFSPKFLFLAGIFGGVAGAQNIHHYMGLVFSFLTIIVFMAGDFPAFARWIKDITSWGKSDINFLKGFPQEFFGGHPELPEQGRFNAGEKANSLVILVGGTLLTVTGLMMWFAEYIPLDMIRWAYPLHSLLAFTLMAVVIAHMYLGLVHPGSKEAINGMLRGTVTREFAKAHHGKWYKEMIDKEKAK